MIPFLNNANILAFFFIEGSLKFKVEIEAFVLMNNHYHLCIYTPNENIDKFMQFFNKSLGKKISGQAGRINRIFGASYKWNLVITKSYFQNVIRYIYQNPIRAGICDRCEQYKFSNVKFNENYTTHIDWWNRKISDREEGLTRKNLRKRVV